MSITYKKSYNLLNSNFDFYIFAKNQKLLEINAVQEK